MQPAIIQIPSPFHKPRSKPVDILVIHAMAEFVTEDWIQFHYCVDFLNRLKLSVHAYCLPDGRIIESVKPELAAFHAAEFNGQSIGMEFLVPGAHDLESFRARMRDVENPPYTQAQYESGGWWFKRMAEKFGLGFEQITTHHELAPKRKEDPGKAFDLTAFKAQFDKN